MGRTFGEQGLGPPDQLFLELPALAVQTARLGAGIHLFLVGGVGGRFRLFQRSFAGGLLRGLRRGRMVRRTAYRTGSSFLEVPRQNSRLGIQKGSVHPLPGPPAFSSRLGCRLVCLLRLLPLPAKRFQGGEVRFQTGEVVQGFLQVFRRMPGFLHVRRRAAQRLLLFFFLPQSLPQFLQGRKARLLGTGFFFQVLFCVVQVPEKAVQGVVLRQPAFQHGGFGTVFVNIRLTCLGLQDVLRGVLKFWRMVLQRPFRRGQAVGNLLSFRAPRGLRRQGGKLLIQRGFFLLLHLLTFLVVCDQVPQQHKNFPPKHLPRPGPFRLRLPGVVLGTENSGGVLAEHRPESGAFLFQFHGVRFQRLLQFLVETGIENLPEDFPPVGRFRQQELPKLALGNHGQLGELPAVHAQQSFYGVFGL